MKRACEFRAIARDGLRGQWGTAVLMYFLYFLISSALSAGSQLSSLHPDLSTKLAMYSVGGSVLAMLLVLPIAYAFTVSLLRAVRGERLLTGWLFEQFKGRVWLAMILKTVYIVLWALLFVIPGIIKSYSYAMTEFILNDNPEMSGEEAIHASRMMMSGNKWRLFCLDFSFIGWILLAICTFGIGFLWVEPYMLAARAAFYEDLKNNAVA